MGNNQGYQATDKDIDGIFWYLQTNVDKDATREDAIEFLENAHLYTHLAAHKLMEDVLNGNIKPQVLKDILKKTRENKK